MPPTETSAIPRSIPLAGIDQLTLFGTQDQNLKLIESLSSTRLVVRNSELRLSGSGVSFEEYKNLVGLPTWSRIEDRYV